MGPVLKNLQRATRRFGRKDDGSATIEALFWIPMFLAVFALIVDVSFIYHNEARVQRIVQDTNRSISVNRFVDPTTGTTDPKEIEAHITERLATLKITPKEVNVSLELADDPKSDDVADQVVALVFTEVVIEAKKLVMVGLYTSLVNSEVQVVGMHIAETAPPDFFDTLTVASTL